MNASATDSDGISYVSAVLALYLELPETPLRTSAQDQRCARQLYDRGVSLGVVESAFLLGSLRRLSGQRTLRSYRPFVRWPTSSPSSLSCSPILHPKTIWSICVSNCGVSPEARS